ncbi:hypothetical protein BV25DRAFT_1366702 [Artomyces pyxidatus]|uniref:Uncharacterized protein n=1 Tax=Artomyces pyxidatus TaxID=48021 RepID=A0ACB8SN17_9AGAM|nr:hypothetical protein BV25DRAFT_1366702 [Artomyces pyxidatus]
MVSGAVMAASLPDDVKLFKELDTILKTIQTCYKDLDKFWIGEVRRVTKALKSRRMEKEDGDRWNGIEAALQEAIDIAKEDGSALRAASPARPPDPCTPNLGQICIGTVAADMGPAMAMASTTLQVLYRSVTPSPHELRLLRADLQLCRNRDAYLAFLQRCASYGRSVVSGCASLALRPVFPRVKDMRDRRARGRAILMQAAPPLSKASDDDGRVSRSCGYARVVCEIAALLQKTERAWDALCKRRNTVFARVLAPDDPDAYIHAGACSARQLSRALRAWAKEGEVLRVAAARLGTRPQTILTAANFL